MPLAHTTDEKRIMTRIQRRGMSVFRSATSVDFQNKSQLMPPCVWLLVLHSSRTPDNKRQWWRPRGRKSSQNVGLTKRSRLGAVWWRCLGHFHSTTAADEGATTVAGFACKVKVSEESWGSKPASRSPNSESFSPVLDSSSFPNSQKFLINSDKIRIEIDKIYAILINWTKI